MRRRRKSRKLKLCKFSPLCRYEFARSFVAISAIYDQSAKNGKICRLFEGAIMIKLSQAAKDRVLAINWLSRVGNLYCDQKINFVQSAKVASKYLSGLEWENTTLKASNAITSFLNKKYIDLYQMWNSLAKEAKIFIDKEVIIKINSQEGLDHTLVVQCIGWDTMHYLIEDAYKSELRELLFFEQLISIYENGHLPCGWEGEWPKGRLIVY